MHYLLYFLFFVFIALLNSEACIASINSDLPVSNAQTANNKYIHETHSIRNKFLSYESDSMVIKNSYDFGKLLNMLSIICFR